MTTLLLMLILLILWWGFYCLITVLEEIRDELMRYNDKDTD